MDLLLHFYPGDAAVRILVHVIVQATLLLAGVYCALRILRRRGAAIRHGIALATMVAIVVLPLATWSFDRARAQIADFSEPLRRARFGDVIEYYRIEDRPSEPVVVRPPQPPPVNAPNANENAAADSNAVQERWVAQPPRRWTAAEIYKASVIAILAVWIAGSALLGIRLILGLLATVRFRRSLDSIATGPLVDSLRRVCGDLQVRDVPSLATNARVTTPLVIGWRRPTIVLPAGVVAEFDAEELREVLVHEVAHIARRDVLVGLLQRAVAVVWWPHPLFHWLNRQLSRSREEVCDNFAVRSSERHHYSRTLVRMSERATGRGPAVPALGLLCPRWSLRERIAGLLDERRSFVLRLGRWQIAAVACVLFLAVTIVSGAKFRPALQSEAIERFRAAGGWISNYPPTQAAITSEWHGTQQALLDLSAIPDLHGLSLNGAKLEELRLDGLLGLKTIRFNSSYYDLKLDRQVYGRHLPLRTLRLSNLPSLVELDLREINLWTLQLSGMDGLQEINFGPAVTDDTLKAAAGAPNLQKLEAATEYWDYGGRTRVTDAGVAAMSSLKRLEHLNLDGARLTDAGVAHLRGLDAVELLSLNFTDIGDVGLASLRELPLTQLWLDRTEISNAGLRRIADDHPGLKSLGIAGTKITADGMEPLRKLKELSTLGVDPGQLNERSCALLGSLPSLKFLVIRGRASRPGTIHGLPQVHALLIEFLESEDGASLRFAPGSLPNLTYLNTRNTDANATRAVFEHLRHLPKLESLVINAVGQRDDGSWDFKIPIHVDDELCRHLAHLKSLRQLVMDGSAEFGDVGVSQLQELHKLERVLLPDARITHDGMAAFAGLKDLTTLQLVGSGITDAGLIHLRGLKGLENLYLRDTSVSREASRALREELPDTNIQVSRMVDGGTEWIFLGR
ncbi:MAG: M56 family metallopeptidase [Planctomycetaceae bacterium]